MKANLDVFTKRNLLARGYLLHLACGSLEVGEVKVDVQPPTLAGPVVCG